MKLFRRVRVAKVEDLAASLSDLIAGLGKLDNNFTEWFARDQAYYVVPARRPDQIAAILDGARIDWDGGAPPRHQPTYSTRLFVTGRAPVTKKPLVPAKSVESPAVKLWFTLEPDVAGVWWGLWAEVRLGTVPAQRSDAVADSLWKSALELSVRTLHADWGVCGTVAATEKITQKSARSHSGWLTYLRAFPETWRAPAPPAETMALADGGWVVAAHPGAPADDPASLEAIAAVQRALDGVAEAAPIEAPRPRVAISTPSAAEAMMRPDSGPSKWAGAKLGGTALALDLPIRAALPFQQTPAAPPAPPPPQAAADAPVAQPVAPSPPAAVPLTIEQYAALSAELAAYPDHRAAVCARYRIESEEALEMVQQRFAEQLRGDPALRERWASLRAAWAAGLPGAKKG